MEDLIKFRELELDNEYMFKIIYSKLLRWRSILKINLYKNNKYFIK